MFSPMIVARVENGFFLVCEWIDSSDEVIAFFVATSAGEGEVLEFVAAAKGLR